VRDSEARLAANELISHLDQTRRIALPPRRWHPKHTTAAGLVFPVIAYSGAGIERVSRVRSTDTAILELLKEGRERSTTFRALIDAIDQSNGIVYVEFGFCAYGHLDGCLLPFLASTDGDRYMRIIVMPKTRGFCSDQLLGLIGHELRHAVEVLEDSEVVDVATMEAMYRKTGIPIAGGPRGFETAAARAAGAAVLSELIRSPRPLQNDSVFVCRTNDQAARSVAPLTVAIHNGASVPEATLKSAKVEVERLFSAASLTIAWVSTIERGTFGIQVTVRRQPGRGPGGMASSALGATVEEDHRQGGSSFVFYERVLTFAHDHHRSVDAILAYTIAHEMGHLLLPAPAHTATGLMKAEWSDDDIRHIASDPQPFTQIQATLMNSVITSVGCETP
jgi:hypothetical protein